MNFDFSGRYNSAFGYTPSQMSDTLAQSGFKQALEQSDNNFQSAVYVFDSNTHFDEITLRNDTNSYLFAYRTLAEDYANVFATPPIMSLSRSKRLVFTPLNDSDIEVIERYGTEPYQITLKGLLIDMENHQFPLDKMETLNRIFEVNSVWKVDSEILAALGIDSLVVLDIEIEFVEGYEDTIAYSLKTRATKSIEYQLINEN